jgi:hypothetical protein
MQDPPAPELEASGAIAPEEEFYWFTPRDEKTASALFHLRTVDFLCFSEAIYVNPKLFRLQKP